MCVRLCEVFPDGASKLVTRQILNLCHRESHEFPQPVVPGEAMQVTVELDSIGQVLAAGNRVRLAVSPTYWPWAWPSPEPVTLTVSTGGSRIDLPEIPADAGDHAPEFGPPEVTESLPVETLATGSTGRTVTRSFDTGRSEMRFLWDSGGHVVYPHGMRELSENEAVYSIVEGDPLSAEVSVVHAIEYERGHHHARVEAHSRMTCDASDFVLEHRLIASEHGQPVRERTWSKRIPRDLV